MVLLLARFAAVGVALAVTTGGAHAAGDAIRGKALYEGCQDCHSMQENGVGPRHKGVFGRTAGTQPGYAYSNALKQSGVVWNETTLDKWLTNPQGFIPGVKMFYHLAKPQDRADVIEFLKDNAGDAP
jgi:cytochrome c